MQCRTNPECRMLMSCRSANDFQMPWYGAIPTRQIKMPPYIYNGHGHSLDNWEPGRLIAPRPPSCTATNRPPRPLPPTPRPHYRHRRQQHNHQPPTSAAAPDSSSESSYPDPPRNLLLSSTSTRASSQRRCTQALFTCHANACLTARLVLSSSTDLQYTSHSR